MYCLVTSILHLTTSWGIELLMPAHFSQLELWDKAVTMAEQTVVPPPCWENLVGRGPISAQLMNFLSF